MCYKPASYVKNNFAWEHGYLHQSRRSVVIEVSKTVRVNGPKMTRLVPTR